MIQLKLKHKILILYLGTCIGILIVVGSLLHSNLKKKQFETINTSLQNQLVHIDFALTDFFKGFEKDLMGIVSTRLVRTREDSDFTNFLNADEATFQYNIGEREQHIIQFFNSYRTSHEYVNSVYMGRRNGSFLRSHKRNRPTRYDPRQRPWYTLGWTNPGKVMKTEPYMSVTSPDVNIGIVTALVDEKNQGYGVVGIDITLARLTKYIENVKVKDNSQMILIDKSGEILASSDQGMRSMNIYSLTRDDLAPLFDEDKGVLDITFTFREEDSGKKYFFFYTSPDLGWKLVFVVPVKEVYAEIDRFLNSIVLVLGLALLLLSVLTLIGIQKLVVNPVKLLCDITNEITRTGNLDQHIEIRTDDEIGELARSFNLMTRSVLETENALKQSEEALKNHRDHLEELVEERTLELGKLSKAVEQSPSSVIITDRNGVVEYVNDSFTLITGYSRAEMIGQNPRVFKSEGISSRVNAEIRDTILTGKVWEGELINRTKNNREIWERTSVIPIKNPEGNIINFVLAAEDITERKKMVESLEKSERDYRLLVKSLPGIVFKGLKDWPIKFYDNKVEQVTGYSRETFESGETKWADLIVKKDLNLAGQKFIEAMENDASYIREYRINTRSGGVVHIQERGHIVYDDQGGIVCIDGVVFDITERKRHERERLASEKKLRAMSEASHDAMIMVNGNSEVMFWNGAAEEMFGYTAQEALGTDMHELFVPPDFRGAARKGMQTFSSTGKGPVIGNIIEHTAHRRDGTSFPVEIAVSSFDIGGEWFAVGSVRDITERKKDEEQIRKLSNAVEQSPDWVVVTNTEGTIEYVNRRFTEITGYRREEAVGKNSNILSSGKTPQKVYEEMWGQILEGKPWSGDLLNRKKNNELFWAHLTISSVWGENGDITHFIGLGEDITSQKTLQKERDEAYTVISGSINYASNIQKSLLPSIDILDKLFPQYFTLWEPRDRVGGDIYFSKSWGLGKILALGDCTGHGVPGAFMSMIVNGALEMATLETPPGDSAVLLQRTHQLIQQALGQQNKESKSDDGIDIGLCYIAPRNKKMVYSGARFSLFKVEDGKVIEIKGNKRYGLGYCATPHNVKFTNHDVEIGSKRSFYMTSDGLIDQVGGPKRLSFGKKRFKHLLLEMEKIPMNQRADFIYKTLIDFQGEERRRDDVSVIGFSFAT